VVRIGSVAKSWRASFLRLSAGRVGREGQDDEQEEEEGAEEEERNARWDVLQVEGRRSRLAASCSSSQRGG